MPLGIMYHVHKKTTIRVAKALISDRSNFASKEVLYIEPLFTPFSKFPFGMCGERKPIRKVLIKDRSPVVKAISHHLKQFSSGNLSISMNHCLICCNSFLLFRSCTKLFCISKEQNKFQRIPRWKNY